MVLHPGVQDCFQLDLTHVWSIFKWPHLCMCRQLFNAQTRKLQIAKETVAKRDEKDIPVENEADAEGMEEALPAEEENE